VAAGELAGIVDPGFLVYISSAQLGADNGGAGSVAFFAHASGFIAGMVLIPLNIPTCRSFIQPKVTETDEWCF
jgi:membrane associated rhomboid family serine protease